MGLCGRHGPYGTLCPSVKGIQDMINASVEYACDHDITYNCNKSQFIVFPSVAGSRCTYRIDIDGKTLNNIGESVHLGHHISSPDKESTLQHAISQLWCRFNHFRADFDSLYSELQCHLFRTYCCCFYGAPLWNLCGNSFKQPCVAWQKCLRKIWRAHHMTHGNIIALLSECKPIDVSIHQQFCEFTTNLFQYGSSVLRAIASISHHNPLSVFCNNYNSL